jgi:hypothetical protein
MSSENVSVHDNLVVLLRRWKEQADHIREQNDFSPHGSSEFSMTHGEYSQLCYCIAEIEELLEANKA